MRIETGEVDCDLLGRVLNIKIKNLELALLVEGIIGIIEKKTYFRQ